MSVTSITPPEMLETLLALDVVLAKLEGRTAAPRPPEMVALRERLDTAISELEDALDAELAAERQEEVRREGWISLADVDAGRLA